MAAAVLVERATARVARAGEAEFDLERLARVGLRPLHMGEIRVLHYYILEFVGPARDPVADRSEARTGPEQAGPKPGGGVVRMRIFIAILFITSVALQADADDAKAKANVAGSYAGEVTATRLQLRAGPSDAYQPVATLKQGDKVVVLGKHATPGWLVVEVPQGYHAWVFGAFLLVGKDKLATVTTDRLLVRPRATTQYHQLNGRLRKGEKVAVVGKKETNEGVWYKIVVPRRFPLYAAAAFLKNVGPASLAEPKKFTAPAGKEMATAAWDKRFEATERAISAELPRVRSFRELQPLRRAVVQYPSTKLSVKNRERRVVLLSKIYNLERKFAIDELGAKEARDLRRPREEAGGDREALQGEAGGASGREGGGAEQTVHRDRRRRPRARRVRPHAELPPRIWASACAIS